ncbi:hypothetical protein IM538_09385 [Cytobacillus suaedae]|nr:hypothetical protein IM538_09385 [Cytobacillus suaedae]
MYKSQTEQEWVYEYVRTKEKPLPVVLGTRGTWSGNGKQMVFLIAFTVMDLFVLADIYHVGHHPIREMKVKDITYFAININNSRQVKDIIKDWNQTTI